MENNQKKLEEAVAIMLKPLEQLTLCPHCMAENHGIIKTFMDGAKAFSDKHIHAQAESWPAMHVPLHVCPKMSGTAWDIIQSGKPCPYCGETKVSDINSATVSSEKEPNS